MPDAPALRHALCSGTGRHLLGLPGFCMQQAVSPKSWVSGRKLRISNCSAESQKKEKVSPPGWYRMNLLSARMPLFRHIPKHGRQAFILPQPAVSRLCDTVYQHDVYPATARQHRTLPLLQAAGFALQPFRRMPDIYIKFIQYQYQLGRDTFSFFSACKQ